MANNTPRHLRVFLASPGDVAEERAIALDLLAGLPDDPLLSGKITLEAVAWNKAAGVPMSAWISPQEAVKRHLPWPSACDIVLVILWSRLGTPLPVETGVKPDGGPYQSGTEWEYLDALGGREQTGKPEVLLYRRTEKVLLDPDQADFEERAAQRKKVQAFFAQFQNPDGSLKAGVNGYANPADFKEKLAHHLKAVIKPWLPETTEALPESPKESDCQTALGPYLDYVQDAHRYLSFRGLGLADRVPLRLPLVDLYVPLKARLELPPGESWDRRLKLAGRELDEEHALRLGESEPVLDLLRRQDGLVILGDPGAGKTTFLKFLALQLAAGRDGELGLGPRLPVLVPLSGYANALEEKRGLRLDEHIAAHFHELGGDWPVGELLKQALRRGEALVLLDGLDEVAEPGLRQTVVDRVSHFYAAHRKNGNKFVLTSRIVGYRDIRPTAEGLCECTLVDFDDDEIEAFVGRWTAALETQAQDGSGQGAKDAALERQGLLEAVRHNPGVRQLAANPLLLTILALMKRQGVSLPERRAELYEQYVKTLLSSWNRARGLGRPPGRDLDPVRTVKILAPLALWMHQANPGVGLVKREDLRRKLEALHRERGEADPEKAARQFLNDVRHHAGLLLERGPGEYGFIHLTFEEYLAAAAVALRLQGKAKAIARALGMRVGQPAWHEIIRLAVGYVGLVQQMDRVAGGVVRHLVERRPGPPGEAVVLAGEAVVDACSAGVDADSRSRVVEALAETMQQTEVPGRLRRSAGLLLGRLGWTPGDLDNFLAVAKGPFRYGEENRERTIDYDFWIAQYPVTNRQFARFIEAGGYRRPEFWTRTGWAWKQADDIQLPRYWDNLELGNPLAPVVGVSWHEAVAYARWLDATTEELWLDGKRVGRPKGLELRLPLEWEWERAARGGDGDGREYPWGDEFDPTLANVYEEDEGRWTNGTTAVGTYPQGASPTGAQDMAGNVWEWCLNTYSRPDGKNLEATDSRVLRGGSWLNAPRYARSACRSRYGPAFRDLIIGFRLVCSSPSLISGL